ncbi:MAG: hypothetical protein MSG64_06135 [Pyrinomonadaceae bacterium MAG19_C2-C3]|nr:hypothetical protein [Pyrinomonadaceae bacterium MAG19_C2-C3]
MNRVIEIARTVQMEGGRLLLVGGCVRDKLMGRTPKDFDAEVYGIEQRALRDLLKRFGRVSTVGESFTVYKLGNDLDISLPRRERKQGRGHRGFVVEGDHTMTPEEAARRRDFTINAILEDPLTGEIIDPFDGREDLRNKILRAVAPETFVEDSLRVLRAAQFAARFEFEVETQTIELCRTIDLTDLPAERVWGELEKLLLHASRPSRGLRWLLVLRAMSQVLPELHVPRNLKRNIGRIFVTIDRAHETINDLPHARQVTVMLAALCHAFRDEALTLAMLERLKIHTLDGFDVRGQVLSLVREQAKPFEIYQAREQNEAWSNGALRRLAARCELNLLWLVALAKSFTEEHFAVCEWFIERARKLNIEHAPPKPLLQGRHLQDMGLKPSPLFGRIIAAVYEMQLDERVTNLDEARAAAEDIIATNIYE